jgi:hypothetical protein
VKKHIHFDVLIDGDGEPRLVFATPEDLQQWEGSTRSGRLRALPRRVVEMPEALLEFYDALVLLIQADLRRRGSR